MADEPFDEQTRSERRDDKRRKKRRAIQMHGASLRRTYPNAVLKRLHRPKRPRFR